MQVADPGDVLLVVGAGRADELGLAPQHAPDRSRHRLRHRHRRLGQHRMHLHHVAHAVPEARPLGRQPPQHAVHLALHLLEPLLDQEAPVEHQPAAVRHAGAGQPVMALGLAAMDGVEVQGRGARTARHHRHGRPPPRQCRPQLALERLDHRTHVPHGAVAQKRHRAVRDPAPGLDLGPPHAAMADAHPVDVERLGDDHVVDPRAGEKPLPRQVGDPADSRPIPRRPCPRSPAPRAAASRSPAASRPPRSPPRARPSCRRCRGRRRDRRGPRRPTDRRSSPGPPGTTSICPLKCTHGPGARSRSRATTLIARPAGRCRPACPRRAVASPRTRAAATARPPARRRRRRRRPAD